MPLFGNDFVSGGCIVVFATPSLLVEGEELRSELTSVRSGLVFTACL